MRHRLFLFLLLVLPATLVAQVPPASLAKEQQEYDFSAVNAALPLAQMLQQGQQPTEQQWQQLFAYPAYQLIFNISSLRPDTVKTRFTIAFHPEHQSTLATLEPFEQQEVLHLRRAAHDLSWYQPYQARLSQRQAKQQALTLAKHWLPDSVGSISTADIVFYYGLFGQNAHASDKGLVMDPYLAYLADRQAEGQLAAHELHHYFRRQLTQNKPLDLTHSFDRVVDHLVHEGVANLIDKSALLSAGSPFSEALVSYFQQTMQLAPDNLARLNTLLNEAIQQQQFDQFASVQQQSLPLWGHSVGWYMCQTIVNAGLAKQLISTMQQPRRLPALYNQAVHQLQSGQPVFSDAVLLMYQQRELP